MRAAAVLALLLAAGCAGTGPGDDGIAQPLPQPPAPLRLLAIGDAGTGEEAQFRVARALEQVCASHGCDAVLDLGDLVYPSGVSDAHDPQFDAKFEQPYRNLTVPFWMVLGNHDNSLDPAGTGSWHARGDAMVAYAARTDRPSAKWTMPARFYDATLEAPAATARIFALDTSVLLFADTVLRPGADLQVQAQEAWIQEALAQPGGDDGWRIAFGHHPYVSNGPHGDAGSYDGHAAPGLSGDGLRAFFQRHLCGNVDLYLAGHDHNLQWLPAQPDCAMESVVSGGGGAGTYGLVGSHEARFQAETLGFWWIELGADGLRAIAFDDQAQPLHELALPRRR